MHCVTDWWQSCRVWEQETSKSCSYCSLQHWCFPDAKLEYDSSKTRKERCLSCVCTMSLDRVLCLGCSPSWLWIWVQTAWDAQIPQVSGTRLTCWRLSHLSPSPAWCWWKTIDITCSRLDSTLMSPHYTDKRQYLKETQGIKNELKVLSSPPTSFEISIELHLKWWGAALLLFVPSFAFLASAFVRVGISSLSRLSFGYINSLPQHKHCINT